MEKAKTIGRWVLKALFAFALFTAGLAKFSTEMWVTNFAEWGYPDNFVYVIGALEMAGAIGLLIPRVAGFAAAGLGVIMIGASVTRLIEGPSMSAIIVHIAYVGILLAWAYTNRPDFLRKPAIADPSELLRPAE